jgi:hypothetical protein
MSRHPADPDFEPRIADWLESDPDHAPAPVLSTVLAAFPSVPQRRASRVPRRLQNMNRFALFGVAAAIIVAAGLGGLAMTSRSPSPGTSGPSPSPASPSPVDLSRSYVSQHYGYTIHYPGDWTVTPATATWMPGKETLWGDPALDVVQGSAARLIAASQSLAAGQTPNDWYVAYCALSGRVPDCARAVTIWPPITIGGQPGLIDIDGDPALPSSIGVGKPMYDAVVVTGGRGYEFTLDGDVDQGLFEQLLAAVTFGPATASRVDHVSSTFTSPLYAYSIAVDPAWTPSPATVAINSPDSTNANCCDLIAVTGTDTTIRVSADPLNGQTVDAYLQNVHQGVEADPTVPGNCKGGDPSAWVPVDVGTHSGVIMTLCNFAVVYVNVRDRMYAFEWGHETFSTSQHLAFGDFKQLLETVTFTGS